MHKLVATSVTPVGQAVTTDWDSQARWLEDPSADRQEEEEIVVCLSDSVAWPALWAAAIQRRALQWSPAQNHWLVLTCGPVACDALQDLSFLCPAYRKLRKNLTCFAFWFPILWKWGLSLLFLLDSMENLHEGVCVLSPFPTHITLPAPSASPLDVISQSQLGGRLPEGSRQGLQGHQGWQNCSRSPHDLEMKVGRKPPRVRTARSWEHLSGLLNASRESLSCTNCFNRAIFTMLSYLLSHWNYKIVTVPGNWEP